MNQESLKRSFGDCKRLDKSQCLLRTSYETIRLPVFYVYDEIDEEPVRVLPEQGFAQLTIRNNNGREICVVKTDKCLFTDEHKKCDCIVFSNDKAYLVEIKSGSKSSRGKLRGKAVEQLTDTIRVLRKNNIDLTQQEVTAIICFKGGKTRPTQASFNTRKDAFWQEHKIMLDEYNEIIF
jgi:hypothetical protein